MRSVFTIVMNVSDHINEFTYNQYIILKNKYKL